jgi:hypothetical protein
MCKIFIVFEIMPGLEQARGPIRQRLKNKENKKKNLTKDR